MLVVDPAKQGHAEVCRYLVLLGLDPHLRDSSGADAFDFAREHPGVVPALSLYSTVQKLRPGDRRLAAGSTDGPGARGGSAVGNDDGSIGPEGTQVGRAPHCGGRGDAGEGSDSTRGPRNASVYGEGTGVVGEVL